jgi:hypothetical protein
MDGTTAFFIFGSLAVTLTFFWAIGSIRRNTAKSATSSAVAAGMMARSDDIKCPKCKEFIKPDAEVCRHCGFNEVQADESVKSQLDFRSSVDVVKLSSDTAAEQMRPLKIRMIIALALIVPSFVAVGLHPIFSMVFMLSVIGSAVFVPMYFSKSKKLQQEAAENLLRGRGN